MNRRSLFRAAFGALVLPVAKILPARAATTPPVIGTRKVYPASGVWVTSGEPGAPVLVEVWAGGGGVGGGGGRGI